MSNPTTLAPNPSKRHFKLYKRHQRRQSLRGTCLSVLWEAGVRQGGVLQQNQNHSPAPPQWHETV
eukprot:2360783-Amphidinium_carterae.1